MFGGLLARRAADGPGHPTNRSVQASLRCTEVSTFALNTEYSVGPRVGHRHAAHRRSLSERLAGSDRDSTDRTIAGAHGVVSAVTVALSMSATALFPMYSEIVRLRRRGYRGIRRDRVDRDHRLTVHLLGPQLESLDVPTVRRLLGRPISAQKTGQATVLSTGRASS